MNIQIRQINILVYLTEFDAALPPLAGYYAGQTAMKQGCMLLGAYVDGMPCGIAVADSGGVAMNILYIAVSELYRKMGICGALLGECISQARILGQRNVRLKYAPEHLSGDSFDGYLRKTGFHKHPHLITAVVPLTGKVKGEWSVFLAERGSRLLNRLEKKGFEAKSYPQTDPEVFEKLFERMGTKFPRFLDPRRCPNKIQERHSFITVRDGNPAAYCIVTSADDGQTAIIEYMAAASEYVGKGAFLLCLVAAVNSLFDDGVCSKIAYAYDANNKSLPKIANDNAWFPDKTIKTMYVYNYNLKTS